MAATELLAAPNEGNVTSSFSAARLERLFDKTFTDFNTRLIGGCDEPLYRPAEAGQRYHHLYYREDFFASALHETSHWCIAGEERRTQLDFGYWYAPEGRDSKQQRQFENAETKPQALEWLFSIACGYRFVLSADNFTAPDTSAFPHNVLAQAQRWQAQGLPQRAERFLFALADEFQTGVKLDSILLSPAELA